MELFLAIIVLALAGVATVLLLRLRRSRSALREAEMLRSRVLRAADHLQDGLVLLGAHDRVRYANSAAVTLLAADAEPDPQTPPPFSRFCSNSPVAKVLQYHEAEETVRRVVEREGDEISRQVLEVTVGPAGEEGRFVLIRDLRAVEGVDQKRRDFVANASHELQTPLAALIGMLDLVETMPDQESRERLLERARANAEQLTAITRDLLGLARAEDPRWQPSPKPVRVAELVEGLRAALETKAQAKGLIFRVVVEPEDLEVLVDPTALETAVRNLLDNAIAYTETGKVSFRAYRSAGVGAVLEVEDTGPGIDPEILPRIFERFFRGDPARSRQTGGTGLGLAIVRNLVARMGGRIAVSTQPGSGSVFRVELPMSPARPLAGAVQTEFRGPSRPLHSGD